MERTEFLDELGKLNPGSTFLTVHKYRNEHGEVCDFSLCFQMNWLSALERSLEMVGKFKPTDDLHRQAHLEVIDSLNQQIERFKTTKVEDLDDGYRRFKDTDGKWIEGVKLHIVSDTLHLFGLANMKRVVSPIVYKPVNHRALTLAKRTVLSGCPSTRFRQFRLRPDQVEKLVVQGIHLMPPDQEPD